MISATNKFAVLAILTSLAIAGHADPQTKATHRSTKHQLKKVEAQPEAQPQPEPIPELAPADLPPQPPQVSYANGQLTIEAQNATLADICDAVGKQTGAQIDVPPNQDERFVVHLSGTPREVLSSLLEGSQLGYIILASQDDPGVVRKVILSKLEANTSDRGAAAVQTPAVMYGRRGSAATRAMMAAQANRDEQDQPETTNSNGPNPAPLDTTVPFQPAPVTAAGQNGDQQPISAPGQFMQELYRLRAQQQQQQNQQTQQPSQPPPTTPQQ